MIKKISLIILLLLTSPIVYGQEKEITKEEKVKEEKTFIGKGLAEIDNVATKAWKELLKLFKKRPFAYKPGKGKHETKIKRHNPPENYIFTKKIVSTSKDSFLSDEIYKKNKADLELKVFYPRIRPGKGYVSFQIGDYNNKRYISNVNINDINYIKLVSPAGDTCEVKKFKFLPRKDVKRHFSFVLDHSGSMGDSRADKLQQAVYNAINYNYSRDLNRTTNYSVHKFDGEGNINHIITSKNIEQLYNSLVPPIGLAGYGKSTAIKDALFQSVENIIIDSESETKTIILFTDGYSNTDQITIPLSDIIRKAIDNNINIVVVGFGRWFDENYLNAIAYFAGGNSYRIWHENEFNQLFENIFTDTDISYNLEFSPCMFGDEIQILMDVNGLNLNDNYTGSTFFATPANQGNSIAIDILFDTGSSKINEIIYANEIDNLIQFLNYKKDLNITIEGHTDKVGSKSLNKDLSLKRALSLKKILVYKGINENRIKIEGYGSEMPAYAYVGNIKSNPLNRRIEIRIN
tara:strand:+ start:425 stop:1981 length:1557 start_codon:yes stop_codon:yes gene_type:complete